jgi:phosphoribosylanthranilate isomerase
MALKTLVKVSGINNLSDARYCAGMGVQMLGFRLEVSEANGPSPARIQEIVQWLSGVAIVAEPVVWPLSEQWTALDWDMIELSKAEASDASADLPLLMRISLHKEADMATLPEDMATWHSKVQYFILEIPVQHTSGLSELLGQVCKQYKVLLDTGANDTRLLDMLEEYQPAGIVLHGGQEIKPGLKDFDEMATILEALEVDE